MSLEHSPEPDEQKLSFTGFSQLNFATNVPTVSTKTEILYCIAKRFLREAEHLFQNVGRLLFPVQPEIWAEFHSRKEFRKEFSSLRDSLKGNIITAEKLWKELKNACSNQDVLAASDIVENKLNDFLTSFTLDIEEARRFNLKVYDTARNVVEKRLKASFEKNYASKDYKFDDESLQRALDSIVGTKSKEHIHYPSDKMIAHINTLCIQPDGVVSTDLNELAVTMNGYCDHHVSLSRSSPQTDVNKSLLQNALFKISLTLKEMSETVEREFFDSRPHDNDLFRLLDNVPKAKAAEDPIFEYMSPEKEKIFHLRVTDAGKLMFFSDIQDFLVPSWKAKEDKLKDALKGTTQLLKDLGCDLSLQISDSGYAAITIKIPLKDQGSIETYEKHSANLEEIRSFREEKLAASNVVELKRYIVGENEQSMKVQIPVKVISDSAMSKKIFDVMPKLDFLYSGNRPFNSIRFNANHNYSVSLLNSTDEITGSPILAYKFCEIMYPWEISRKGSNISGKQRKIQYDTIAQSPQYTGIFELETVANEESCGLLKALVTMARVRGLNLTDSKIAEITDELETLGRKEIVKAILESAIGLVEKLDLVTTQGLPELHFSMYSYEDLFDAPSLRLKLVVKHNGVIAARAFFSVADLAFNYTTLEQEVVQELKRRVKEDVDISKVNDRFTSMQQLQSLLIVNNIHMEDPILIELSDVVDHIEFNGHPHSLIDAHIEMLLEETAVKIEKSGDSITLSHIPLNEVRRAFRLN